MNDADADFILILIEEQAPVVFDVDGTIYEGRMQHCWHGVVSAVARRYGAGGPWAEYAWRLDQVRDFARLDAPVEVEDPLIEQGRELARQAQKYGELSLAEQLLVNRLPKGSQ